MADDLSQLTERQMLALLPRVLLRTLPDREGRPKAVWSAHHTALLFIDISGFSTVASRLQKFTDEGAEALSFHLNCYFERLINVVRDNGGDVVFFSGDAMLVVWHDDPGGATQAVNCGVQMLRECGEHSFEIDADGQPLTCSMSLHIGGATGPVCALIVGGSGSTLGGQWKYVLTGLPVELAGVAANLGRDGQFVLTDEMLGAACRRPQTQPVSCPVRGQSVMFALVDTADALALSQRQSPSAPPELPISPLVSPAALRHIAALFSFDTLLYATLRGTAGELRTVSTVFVQFTGIDCVTADPAALHGRINQAVRCVQKALMVGDGVLNKVMMDDKGLICLCLFGIPHHTHQDDAARALAFAHRVRRRLGREAGAVSMGISRAHVFCGLTGSSHRNEYTVLGDGVNIAARLMCKAADFTGGKRRHAMCDEETMTGRGADRVGVAFVEAENILLKGQTEPTRCFHVVAEKDKVEFERELRDSDSDGLETASSGSSASSRSSRSSICSMDSSSSRGPRRTQSIRKAFGKVAALIRSTGGGEEGSPVRAGSLRKAPVVPKRKAGGSGSDGDVPFGEQGLKKDGSQDSLTSQGSARSASSRNKVVGVGRTLIGLLKSPMMGAARRAEPRESGSPEPMRHQRKSVGGGGADTMLQDLYDDTAGIPTFDTDPAARGQLETPRGGQGAPDAAPSPGEAGWPGQRPSCSSTLPVLHKRSAGATRPLVGRAPHLARLRRMLLQRGADQRGAAMVFAGGPGSGKTALLRAAGEIAEQGGMACITLCGSELLTAEQFAPLRDTVAAFEPEQIQELLGEALMKSAPLLSHVACIPGLAPPRGECDEISDEERMQRAREVLLRLLCAAHAPRPLAILVDDVQWVDAHTRAWVAHALRSGRCWVVATRRAGGAKEQRNQGLYAAAGKDDMERRKSAFTHGTDESQDFVPFCCADPPEGELDALLKEKAHEQESVLEPLSAAHSTAVLRTVWGCADVDRVLAQQVHERSAGVPGHTVDLAVALQEGGVVQVRLGRASVVLGATVDESAAASLPAIEVAVMRQVDRLDATQRRALSVAAVLGARFCIGALADCLRADAGDPDLPPGAVGERAGPSCGAVVTGLAERGLLRVELRNRASKEDAGAVAVGGELLRREAVVGFEVPLERDVIYNSVLARDRRRLHAIAASRFIAGAPLPRPSAFRAEVALHCRRSGDLAGCWALVSDAYHEAVARGDALGGLQNVADLIAWVDRTEMARDSNSSTSVSALLPPVKRGTEAEAEARPTRWHLREWNLGAALCLYEMGHLAAAQEHSARSGAMAPGEGPDAPDDQPPQRAAPRRRGRAKRRRGWCCCRAAADSASEGEQDGAEFAPAHLQQAQALALTAECMLREGAGGRLRSLGHQLAAAAQRLPEQRGAVSIEGLRAALGEPLPDSRPPLAQPPDTAFDVVAITTRRDALERLELCAGPDSPPPQSLRPLAWATAPPGRAGQYSDAAPRRSSVVGWCLASRAAMRLLHGDGYGTLQDATALSRRDEPRGVMMGATLANLACLFHSPAVRGLWLRRPSMQAELGEEPSPTANGSGEGAGRGGLQPPPPLSAIRDELAELGIEEGCQEGVLLLAAEALEEARRSGQCPREAMLTLKVAEQATVTTVLHGVALIALAQATAFGRRDVLGACAPLLAKAADTYPCLRPAAHYYSGLAVSQPRVAREHWVESTAAATADRLHHSPHALQAAARLLCDPEAGAEQHAAACAFVALAASEAGGHHPAADSRHAAAEAGLKVIARLHFDVAEADMLRELRLRLCG